MFYFFRIGPLRLLLLAVFFLMLADVCALVLIEPSRHSHGEVLASAIVAPIALYLCIGAVINACRMIAAFFGLAFRWRRRA